MKKVFIILLMIPFVAFSQTKDVLDFVAPMHEGVAAVKKGNTWGFINAQGDIVVNFRDDLVSTKTNQGLYPAFFDGKCIISVKKDGISFFGYINNTGKIVIEPQFLNAHNFKNGEAVVLNLLEENLGKNEVLGKNVVMKRYFEVVIDKDGNVKSYLNPEGVNVVLDKRSLKNPPKITSKKISDNLYAVLNKDKKWIIIDTKPISQ